MTTQQAFQRMIREYARLSRLYGETLLKRGLGI